MTGSFAAANGALDELSEQDADAAQVADNDLEILIRVVKYPSIVALYENAGLSDRMRDGARRLTKRGYVVLDSDYPSRLGDTRLVTPKGTGTTNIRELAPGRSKPKIQSRDSTI
jgi:hypothetical protein